MFHVLTASTFSSLTSLSESGFTLSAQAVSRSFVASLAFLLYDIMLTLDEEVELIWRRRKWSLFKALYFYVRYVPFILQLCVPFIHSSSKCALFRYPRSLHGHRHWHSFHLWNPFASFFSRIMEYCVPQLTLDSLASFTHLLHTSHSPLLLVGTEVTPLFHFTSNDCFIWQVYQGVVTIVVFAPVDYILVARIYALFHSSPLVQLFVSVSYVASIVIMVVGLGLAVTEVTFDEICHTTKVPRKVLINGGAEVAFQTLLFFITLYKFISILRAEGWRTVRAIPILQIVVKDGTWAFLVLFTLVAAQALVYVTGKEGGILFGWVLCAFSFCGYRILLNLNHVSHSRRRQTRASRVHSHAHSTSISSSRHSIHANSRSLSTRGTGSLVSLCSQITQWAEYISPVSFDDWDDYEHVDSPSHGQGLEFNHNQGGPETFATTFSGGSQSYTGMDGNGVGQEHELMEMASPRNER